MERVEMLSNKIEKAINDQINAELYSAYLYASMMAYFDAQNLSGFANWMKVQVQEETAHAMKFYHYVNERGGTVTLTAIDAPPTEWDSPLAVFEEVYSHEQKVTSLIHDLVDMAMKENDHATNNFLQWFVAEQVEEEASADEILQMIIMTGDAPGAQFMLNRELGQRVFHPPTAEE